MRWTFPEPDETNCGDFKRPAGARRFRHANCSEKRTSRFENKSVLEILVL